MTAKSLSIIVVSALLALASGCAVETVPPAVPEGTVYDGPGATYGSDNTDQTGECTVDCSENEAIANGFKATVTYDNGDIIQLENAGNTLVAVSTGGVASFTTPNLFDGERFYNFSYGFRAVKGQYEVIDLQAWASNPQEVFSKSGFDYGEGTADAVAPEFSTDAEGVLTVQSVGNDRIAVRHEGTALLDGETVSIEAQFNVPLQEQ